MMNDNFLTTTDYPLLPPPYLSTIPLWQWDCSSCPYQLTIRDYLQPLVTTMKCPRCGQLAHLAKRDQS